MPMSESLRLDLPIFIATTPEDVPAGAHPFASVDGSVPGATWTWDHHRSGEMINLDAMPGRIDTSAMAGIGTTMADCDALASVVAVLLGGEDALPDDGRAVLRAASYHCDHLRDDPSASGEQNRRGESLNRFVSASLVQASTRGRGAAFAALCRGIALAITRGEPLPQAPPSDGRRAATALRALGRLRRSGDLVIVDWRGLPVEWRASPAIAFEAEPEVRVGIWIEEHPREGPRFTVGAATGRGPRDLGPMLLALAQLEFEHGPPCLEAKPGPGSENWGGRATVFGSPWNYGSRLTLEEVERAWNDVRDVCLTEGQAEGRRSDEQPA